MSLNTVTYITDTNSFPRVSGDEPLAAVRWPDTPKFSPRERG